MILALSGLIGDVGTKLIPAMSEGLKGSARLESEPHGASEIQTAI
jgi:hypothetical protein